MSDSAYAAFVLHQLVLVGLVLATRHVAWPPEVEYLTGMPTFGDDALADFTFGGFEEEAAPDTDAASASGDGD